jgi:hypothetical protein
LAPQVSSREEVALGSAMRAPLQQRFVKPVGVEKHCVHLARPPGRARRAAGVRPLPPQQPGLRDHQVLPPEPGPASCRSRPMKTRADQLPGRRGLLMPGRYGGQVGPAMEQPSLHWSLHGTPQVRTVRIPPRTACRSICSPCSQRKVSRFSLILLFLCIPRLPSGKWAPTAYSAGDGRQRAPGTPAKPRLRDLARRLRPGIWECDERRALDVGTQGAPTGLTRRVESGSRESRPEQQESSSFPGARTIPCGSL